jgi:2,5-furandicarboxylate decarboxylase 1
MAANPISDLATIVETLDAMGRLVRVRSEVDPRHDLAGIAARLEGGPRAVLFERVKGHTVPVFTGLYWSRALLGDLMGRPERALPQYVSDCIKAWQQRPVAPVMVRTGPVFEVTEKMVDLGRMPIPIHALKDGGPYFDAGVVIALDPETGVRNASIQRFLVQNRNTLHVNIDAGRHLELYLNKAAAKGESLPFSLNVGVGPGLHFAAATPAEAAPADTDELGIASEFHGAPLELVKGKVLPVHIVANAMYALECEMIPGEVADEGPFAEVTGYYAKREPRPVVHVRAIHRRAEPVFQTILSGAEVWNSVGLLGEANVLALLQRQVPGVKDVYFSHGGCGFYHAIVQIAQKRAGWSKQAIMAAFAAFPPLKMVTVVDDDVDIRSASDVEWAMATRLDPEHGILRIGQVFGHGLNPSFPDYIGTKVGFDCCRPFPHSYEYDRASYKPMTVEGLDMVVPEIKPGAGGGDKAAAKPRTKGKSRGGKSRRNLASGGSAM